jgi:hypothetical protein
MFEGMPYLDRAASRPGEVLAAGIHDRAFDRTGSRIELPRPDFVVARSGAAGPDAWALLLGPQSRLHCHHQSISQVLGKGGSL